MNQFSEEASKQGKLWGHGYRDWVDYQEPTLRPLWLAVLDAAQVRTGTRFLEAGCGAGGALVAAGERGAELFGIDPSINLITVARERLPRADLRPGEIENIPFPNGEFDAVAAINSMQYAANPQLAVHELGRVLRAEGRAVIAVHGDPAESDMNIVTEAILALFDKRPSGGPFALSSRGALESLIEASSGLELDTVHEAIHTSEYPSLGTAVRAMMSAGGSRRAAEILGEKPVQDATRDALTRFEQPDRSVRMRNQYRRVVAVKR